MALLEREAGLEAKTVFGEWQRRYPQRFQAGQLRTLQRRFRDWRALNGPTQEVFFPQVHCPGEQCQSDFTDMRALEVTIGGESYPHLPHHFVLTYSNPVLRYRRVGVGGGGRSVSIHAEEQLPSRVARTPTDP